MGQATTPAANGSCPQVWFDIAADLKPNFFGCTRLAADAIRFAFHDAGECLSKPQNENAALLIGFLQPATLPRTNPTVPRAAVQMARCF